jgi:Domain of unknown function (DUF4403)
MGSGLDILIYHATAPIRLFGRSRKFRLAVGGACIVAIGFMAARVAFSLLAPPDSGLPEAIAIMQPPPALQPVTHTSRVVAPVAVALTAIARAVDADTPREFSGTNDNPVTQLLRQAEIGLTVTRGTMSVSGQSNTLSIIRRSPAASALPARSARLPARSSAE